MNGHLELFDQVATYAVGTITVLNESVCPAGQIDLKLQVRVLHGLSLTQDIALHSILMRASHVTCTYVCFNQFVSLGKPLFSHV